MASRVTDYIEQIRSVASLLRSDEIEWAYDLLDDARRTGRGVYIFGNGGSASTASHLAADLGKNICTGPMPRMHVVSLTDNVPWLTALANDNDYADCFAGQLRNYLRPGDVVIGVSASGDSENVVRAFQLAQKRGAHRLALIGFDGGRLAALASRRIWIDSHDYGIVESLHLVVAHLLVQMLSEGSQSAAGPVEEREPEQVRVAHVAACRISDPPLTASWASPAARPMRRMPQTRPAAVSFKLPFQKRRYPT